MLLILMLVAIIKLHFRSPVVHASSSDSVSALHIAGRAFQFQTDSISNSVHNITIIGDDFYLDGKIFQIVSGSIHYFRMPHQYWRDRLRKLKAVGFNAVATYIEWSHHEPEERQYRFTGDYNVAEFIKIAAEEGLWVLLRPGPYICAERDLGGLPYWLLGKYPYIRLRTTDKDFIAESRIWMTKLFDHLSPYLAGNGGPIILVQVENEYGNYGSDMEYKVKIRDMIKEHVGTKAVLYTTDGYLPESIRKGAVPGTLTTIDFGSSVNIRNAFMQLRIFMPTGPLMNSEFYPGWLTHWGEQLQQVDKHRVVKSLQDMLNNKINVNMYVFFGGTNFEFSAGANFETNYLADITSYDYDAPLSEAGDPTAKYYAIRQLMQTFLPQLNAARLPISSPKGAYGTVHVEKQLKLLSPYGRSKLGKKYPDVDGTSLPTFEKMRQRAGLMLYETIIRKTHKNNGDSNSETFELQIQKPRDRVYIFVNGEFQGVISRVLTQTVIHATPNSILSLLVESQGRINYGSHLHDNKGILGVVKLDGRILNGSWTITGFPLENIDLVDSVPISNSSSFGPVLYKGDLMLPLGQTPLDTFLDPTGWGKGYVWVNGHNLGRYWPDEGPQVTLYVPGVWLRPAPAINSIVILELETKSEDLTVIFIDYPVLNRTRT